MRAATMGARIIRNLSWLIIIAIFVAGTAAKGEERLPFLGAGATTCQGWINARAVSDTKPDGTNPILSFALESWVFGFADVLERVDNFCKAHPTSVVFSSRFGCEC
jgi:hypothetical protein